MPWAVFRLAFDADRGVGFWWETAVFHVAGRTSGNLT
ncbi:hypothetical protein Pan14r_34220 [Crateriforma conspicua]|uniref:Uncharacterized protein n=1 Tax=Crateriforma conspicua TaxID=2527996 RepID=A0A5C5YCQ9_9PLAN|nr:hypothetical protein Mal65_48850 [Crateriforma conspicua]TWT71112.1 hypothetical protein Pan14r_34220 [Crateriforma conspicua]